MEDQGSVFHAPTSAIVTVMRKRPREYLTEAEIERLMTAAKDNRHGHRDATAILVARHGHYRSAQEGCGRIRHDCRVACPGGFELTEAVLNHISGSRGGIPGV